MLVSTRRGLALNIFKTTISCPGGGLQSAVLAVAVMHVRVLTTDLGLYRLALQEKMVDSEVASNFGRLSLHV